MYSVARFFIVLGVIFVIMGLIILLVPSLSILRLPGDIVITRNKYVLVFPIVTSIVLSILLTMVLNILTRK